MLSCLFHTAGDQYYTACSLQQSVVVFLPGFTVLLASVLRHYCFPPVVRLVLLSSEQQRDDIIFFSHQAVFFSPSLRGGGGGGPGRKKAVRPHHTIVKNRPHHTSPPQSHQEHHHHAGAPPGGGGGRASAYCSSTTGCSYGDALSTSSSSTVIVTSLCSHVVTIMLKRTGTKQRSDDRTTNLSRLTIICWDNNSICWFYWRVVVRDVWKRVVGKPGNPGWGNKQAR